MSKSPTPTYWLKNPVPGLGSSTSLTPICARFCCATRAIWRVDCASKNTSRTIELLAVLLAHRSIELPAQRVQVPARLVGVVSAGCAVVLVAELAGDEDVVVQRHRVIGQAMLDDVDDGLAIDAPADRQAEPLVGHDGPRCAVECEVVPRGGRARRITTPAVRWAVTRSSSVPMPAASIALFCRAGRTAEASSPKNVMESSRGLVPHHFGDCASTRFAARLGRSWTRRTVRPTVRGRRVGRC